MEQISVFIPTYNRPEQLSEVLDCLLESDIPLKISGATFFPTLIKAKEDLSPDLDNIIIDWRQYFIRSYKEIVSEELGGLFIEGIREEFFSTLYKKDEKLQKRVLEKINKPKDKLSQLDKM